MKVVASRIKCHLMTWQSFEAAVVLCICHQPIGVTDVRTVPILYLRIRGLSKLHTGLRFGFIENRFGGKQTHDLYDD